MPAPSVRVHTNTYSYSIQNMDEQAKCDLSSLTAHYDGFDIEYSLTRFGQLVFTIINKANKDLIIDKTKCFVLYDGYARELFRDVRSGRMTTYNNVQDAISSVQTNESSITMSIPAYSKWMIPIEETNIESVRFPEFVYYDEEGDYPFTPYSTNATIEYIIPFSYDYSLAKWNTSRNRLFIGNVHVSIVEKTTPSVSVRAAKILENGGKAFSITEDNPKDVDEYNRVRAYNNELLGGRVPRGL